MKTELKILMASAGMALAACSNPTLERNEDTAVGILNGCTQLSEDYDARNGNKASRIDCDVRGHATAIFNVETQSLTVLPDVPEQFETKIGGINGEFTLSPRASAQVQFKR